MCTWQTICKSYVPSHQGAKMLTTGHKKAQTRRYTNSNGQMMLLQWFVQACPKTGFISICTQKRSSFHNKLMFPVKLSMGNLVDAIFTAWMDHMMNHHEAEPEAKKYAQVSICWGFHLLTRLGLSHLFCQPNVQFYLCLGIFDLGKVSSQNVFTWKCLSVLPHQLSDN